MEPNNNNENVNENKNMNEDTNKNEHTNKNENHFKVLILGSGPAGLTAALYTARANLSPLLLEGIQPGGQLTTTTEVENFPGFPQAIEGFELVQNMKQQSERFGAMFKAEQCISTNFQKRPYVVKTHNSEYTADSIIIATGAAAKYLGLKTELELIGHGVSACATCDGYFFKQKIVAVVGGGDSACEEANFLTKFANKVYIIHRRNAFRASKIMQQRVFDNKKIEVIWNTTLTDVIGNKEKGVSALKLLNVETNKETLFECDGLFLAIGHSPNTKAFEGQLKLDNNGYIIVDAGTTNTSVQGIFACGDVQDTRYKQAITAAGTGCMAAMDCEKYLESLHDSK